MAGRNVLQGDTAMHRLLRCHDWSACHLGEPEQWHPALRATLRLLLGARLPMFMAGGSELEFFYNDAYSELLGPQHPKALGRRFEQLWPETARDRVLERILAGVASGIEMPSPDSTGNASDAHRHNFTCSPIHDDSGQVLGFYGTGIRIATLAGQDALSLPLQGSSHGDSRRRLADHWERQARERAAELRESEAYTRAILETTYQYMGILDLEGRILDCNRASLEGIQRELSDVIGMRFPDSPWFTGTPGAQAEIREAMAQVSAGATVNRELGLRLPIGERALKFALRPILDAEGRPVATALEAIDITEHKRFQEDLRTSEERWKLALEAAGDGVWDWNLQTGTVIYSGNWLDLLGQRPDHLPTSFSSWRGLIHASDVSEFIGTLRQCIRGHIDSFASECRVSCLDGSWKWILTRGAVVEKQPDGTPLRLVGICSDISDRKQAEQEALEHANYDALTGLPNRRLFRERLEQQVKQSQSHGLPIALLFIDLDRFKEVNDLLGHDAGDLLLKQAAQRIRKCVRDSDTVARLGGDEFTVILTQFQDSEAVHEVAAQILETLAQPFRLMQDRVTIAASIGITLCPADGQQPETLLRNADQAMYDAKRAGRNRYSFFSPRLQDAVWQRLLMIHELRQVLPKNQLRVYYQPMVDLHSNTVVKAEALLRWLHPERGLILPGEFIGLAEETGLINEIGNWVFHEAATWARRWSDQLGHTFQISVNKSPAQFLKNNYTGDWTQYLDSLGLAGNAISIEITEGMLLNVSHQTTEQLAYVQNAGIQLAIDDFGTGYSSLAYLKRFDVDYLKIDQSFVRDMASDTTSRTIAETIIVMAHKLGLRVIAEGVETEQQRDWLKDAGCDYAQGFLYAQAVPPQEFSRLLAASGELGFV